MKFGIIGGGIQGLSTGLILEELGHETEIYTEYVSYIDGERKSSVSTNYAAASVNPVRLEAQLSDEKLYRKAEDSFLPFAASDIVPVDWMKKYKLYEEQYESEWKPAKNLSEISPDMSVPSRPGKPITDGSQSEVLFVQMPQYIPLLYDSYIDAGGAVIRTRIDKSDVSSLTEDNIVVNCTGYGSRTLFDDTSMRALKGHILEVPYRETTDEVGDFTYIYTAKEYDSSVYMYPRSDAVLFGGSEIDGVFIDGEWQGNEAKKTMQLDGTQIPERLYTVNKSIMSQYMTINRDEIEVTVGYRPYRQKGLRVERNGDVIHNYGHGGGGVSLSWYTALNAVSTACEVPENVLERVVNQMEETTKHLAN